MTTHTYGAELCWTGNRGTGTSGYRDYDRAHEVSAEGKPAIPGSADLAFRGDPAGWNPEELLVVSLSQCHLLWYLHLAATAKVVVVEYRDTPVGTMTEARDGGGRFDEVVLRPAVVVADEAMLPAAERLHEDAHALCFIARSVNFPVRHEATARCDRDR